MVIDLTVTLEERRRMLDQVDQAIDGAFHQDAKQAGHVTTAISLLMSFPSSWSVFGLSIGATLLFLASGLLIGFWVVYRWTAPAQLGESQPRQEA